MTFDLDLLTWISIGVIYSSRTIYLLSLKLLGKAFLSYQLHNVKGYQHTNQPTCAKQYAPPFSKDLIIHNLNVKFESGWAKTVVCIVSTRSHIQSTEVDLDPVTQNQYSSSSHQPQLSCEVWKWLDKSYSLYHVHKVKRDGRTHALTWTQPPTNGRVSISPPTLRGDSNRNFFHCWYAFGLLLKPPVLRMKKKIVKWRVPQSPTFACPGPIPWRVQPKSNNTWQVTWVLLYQNPSSGSGEVEILKKLRQTDRRTTR